MHFFGILGIILKIKLVYFFYILPKLLLRIIHFKNLIRLYIIFYQSDASIKVKSDSASISNSDMFQYYFFDDGIPLTLHFTESSSGISFKTGVIIVKQSWYIMAAGLERKASGTVSFDVVYF